MQTIRITTSQNIDIDYEIAGLGERIVSYLIDFAIFLLIGILCLVTGAIALDNFREVTTGMFIIIYLVLYVFYDLVCEIFMNGQSIGKRVMKIKVISLDGGQASVGQYMLRWLFRIIDFFPLTSGACALITVAVTEKSQRIGDLVAGTTLVRTEPRTRIDAIAFTPHKEDYVPVFNEVTQLSDKDIVLIHEVLASYIKSGNTVILHNTAAKLKQVLHIDTKMDDMMFLQTLVRDYNHIAAAMDVL
jgi:uncharacterized RDD family membrane protein YckC